MKKIDIYIIKKFLETFFLSISLIIIIVIIFDISENIDDLISSEAPLNEIIFDYYLNFIPYFVNLFSPLFTFIAVIYFTSKMATHSEIVSILSSGVSFARMLRPYMITAFMLTAMSFYLANFLIPHTNINLWNFKYTYIKNKYYNNNRDIHMQIAQEPLFMLRAIMLMKTREPALPWSISKTVFYTIKCMPTTLNGTL